MTYDYDFGAPEDLNNSAGQFIDRPGVYHLLVQDVDEHPATKAGKPLNGFRVKCTALAGGPKAEDGSFLEKDKTVNLMFFAPNLSSKDQGKFSRKKIGRFLVATGLIKETDAGKKLSIDLQQAKDAQVIAKLEFGQDADGNESKYLDLAYSDIWHIDDPDADGYPKDNASVSLLPASARRDPKSFNWGGKKEVTKDDLSDM